jgi:protein-S-isoprenylcysteine O-methyltransferase Ste14
MLILKTLLFTLLAPCMVTLAVPYLLLRSRGEIFPKAWNSLHLTGIFIIVAGVAIYIWCAGDFISKGKGTPAPYDPPQALVAQGLYRFTRNPMYIGILTMIAGEALFFKSIALVMYATALLLLFHLRVTLYEEPALKRLFGESFDDYCRRVPRWLGFHKPQSA